MRFILLFAFSLLSITEIYSQIFVSRTGHLNIRSENSLKNIEADNYQMISILDLEQGTISFEGLLKSFEFQLGALDRVFQSEKVNIKQFPKIKFEGKIKGAENVDLTKFGEYPVQVDGFLYIWDEKRRTKATGTLTSIGDGQIFAYSGFLMQIEEGSMKKIDQILDKKLPDGLNLSTKSLGVSRDINVLLDVSFKKR